ncbi:putative RNA polymerase II nuclear localization protein SLC7A6OS [Acropora cervicornis]|uniref:Probable RNA polymerase II nuclear localization protein SLC7A6OS n=1 Tax=Acropora cervicornis TaxID=6130 RepID=A0AAD9QG64_ACRCE|nr:putative RNA polymerase II nuclear localization protein SLC7A6OS [Acropora cervicornis]
MAAKSGPVVLRIKRKRSEDPLDALLVAQVLKKPHIEKKDVNDKGNTESHQDFGSSTVERVFTFFGSVPQGDDSKKKDLLAKIHKQCVSHENLMKSYLPDQQKIQERLRQKKKLLNQESRFKVISSHRENETSPLSDEDNTATFSAGGSSNVFNPSEDTEDDVDLEVQRLLSVYDVVKDEKDQNCAARKEERSAKQRQNSDDPNAILCNNVKMFREKLTLSEDPKTEQKNNSQREGYVYDFYYPSDNYGRLGEIVEVVSFDYEVVNESLRDDFGHIYDDEDDSNEEGNWRNDYPDEEEDLSDSSQERRFYGDYGFDSDEGYRRYAFDDNASDDD